MGRTMIAIMAAAMAMAAYGTARAGVAEGNYAFVDVAVVPMDSKRVLRGQTVVVRDGTIVRMGPVAAINLTKSVRVIDGKGRYLTPSLADMHVHLIGGDEQDLPLYVANGITLVRNMWGSTATLKLRQRVNNGALLGPTIVTAGPLLDGDPPVRRGSTLVRTPADAARLVAEQKAAGYDFVKIYSNLRLDVFDAIASAAKRERIPFAGHVPKAVSVDHAMCAGMASMEHLYGFKQATVRQGVDIGTGATPAPQMIAIGRRLATGETSVDQLFDPAGIRKLGKLAARTQGWITPTLIVLQQGRLSSAGAERQLERPEMRYVTPGTKAYWNSQRTRKRSAEDEKTIEALLEIELREIGILHHAGAPLLAGSDAPNALVFPGFSLHEELALLVRAGLTPYEAMVTATRNPGKFLGLRGFGTIAVGHRADLLLLRANPLEDISRLRQPLGVMLHGRWLPEPELRQLLESVAQKAAAMPTPTR